MKIVGIQECGSSNMLRWAINNGADLKNDMSISSIINNELFYLVTVENVNMLELFQLIRAYREKIRILQEHMAEIPTDAELEKSFIGTYKSEDNEMKLSELVGFSCSMFTNLAMQMNADDDIIRRESARLFIPMLCRKYDITFPLSFIDFLATFQAPEDAAKLFNQDYPGNINEVIFESGNTMVTNMIMLYLIKATAIAKYNDHYDKLLKLTKYAPLRKCDPNSLFKFRMCGFSKYNNITRGEIRCSFFNASKTDMEDNIKRISMVKTPLKVDFVVQLPIQYMLLLANTYSAEELGIAYESSMSTIVESDLKFNDFVSKEFEEGSEEIESYNNAIEAYRTRINEANKIALNAIHLVLDHSTDPDFTNTFAMLPSIYMATAVITINMEYENRYLNHFDASIRDMFEEMVNIAKSISQ